MAGFDPVAADDAALVAAVAVVARRFVVPAWAQRFCHEAARKPERLMYLPIGTFATDLGGRWFVARVPVDVAAREAVVLLLAPGGDAVVAVSEEGLVYGGT